jgi:O-antigen/teichoic acid export membrane protein
VLKHSTQVATQGPAPRSYFFRRVLGGTFNYGLGSILPQVINFFLLPVYSACLSLSDFGILELTSAFAGVLVILMRLGVPGAVTRFYFDYREGPELRNYVTTIARFMWCSSLAVGLLAMLVILFAGKVILPSVPLRFTFLVILTSFLACNADLQRRLLQAREQSRYSALLSLCFAGLTIALAVFFVAVIRLGALGMIVAQLLAGFVFFVQAQYYLAPELKGSFSRTYLGSSVTYALGIFPSHVFANFAPLLTRSVLANTDSLAAVGTFGIAGKFSQPLSIIFSAFSTAFLPIYFSARRDDSAEHRELVRRTVCGTWVCAVLLCLAAMLLGPAAIRIMTPPRYHDAAQLVHVLAIGFLGQGAYSLFSPEIAYTNKTWCLSLASITAVLLNVGGAFVFVRAYGATGVAWALVLGQFGGAGICGFFALRLIRWPYAWGALLRVTLAGALAASFPFVFQPSNPWLQGAFGLGALLFFVLLLWVVGDPTIKAVAEYLQCRFGPDQAGEEIMSST